MGLCGYPSPKHKPSNDIDKVTSRNDEVYENWIDKWLISPKHSLFEAWMSLNPTMNSDSRKKIKDRLPNSDIEYYVLNSNGNKDNVCLPVKEKIKFVSSEGKNLVLLEFTQLHFCFV